MRVGLPKALLYYRCGFLWEHFFRGIGCDVVTSGDTNRETLTNGIKCALDETCLPLKVFIGHVRSLMGRCDAILIPRFVRTGRNEEFCVRFWGLVDLVQNTFPEVTVLSYNLDSSWRFAEPAAFMKMGWQLGVSPAKALRAYWSGLEAQRRHDRRQAEAQQSLFSSQKPKIFIAAQPYLAHDPFIGGAVQQIIEGAGGVPLFADRCDAALSRSLSKELSQDLYWTLNKESIGAIALHKNAVDGIILLTAFPCGSDSLVNELVLRRIKNIPLIQILIDEHQAQAGLETRIESFMDILRQRRAYAQNA